MSVFSVLDAEQRNSWKGGHTACLSLVAKTALALVSQHRDWLHKGQIGDEKLITITEDERCYYWYRVRLSAEHYNNLFPLLETELRKLGFDDFMAEFYTLLVVNNLSGRRTSAARRKLAVGPDMLHQARHTRRALNGFKPTPAQPVRGLSFACAIAWPVPTHGDRLAA